MNLLGKFLSNDLAPSRRFGVLYFVKDKVQVTQRAQDACCRTGTEFVVSNLPFIMIGGVFPSCYLADGKQFVIGFAQRLEKGYELQDMPLFTTGIGVTVCANRFRRS